jgi:hypothetical protein
MGTIRGSVFRDALAANFNGTDEYAYVDDPSFEADQAGALCFRYRPATVHAANGFEGIIGFGVRDAGNDSVMRLSLRRHSSYGHTNNRLEFSSRLTHGGLSKLYLGSTNISAATTYSVVIQSNGSTVSLYLNGAIETFLLRESSIGSVANTTNDGQWLGDVSGTDHRLAFGAGYFSNAVSMWNDCRLNECIYVGGRALTGAEITEWHNAGVTRNPHRLSFRADVDSWWRFGDSRDTGSTIYDEIGSNNLTTVNMDASNYVAP